MVGQPALVREIDCLTVTLDDVKAVSADFKLPVFDGETRVSGFAGWFDVQFQASLVLLQPLFLPSEVECEACLRP